MHSGGRGYEEGRDKKEGSSRTMKKIIRVALMFSWDKLHVAVSISLALAGLVLFYK